MNIHSIHWDDMPWKPFCECVERKVFSGDGATGALHRLMPGDVVPLNGCHQSVVVGDEPVLTLDVFTPTSLEYA